ncbi:uncharacterized protein [Palaemon carinicauda]|uniref:uncharacterized protein n=1 Tax=Palaemon carinicauda TaxID=392227 RepID=UPI0035B662B6
MSVIQKASLCMILFFAAALATQKKAIDSTGETTPIPEENPETSSIIIKSPPLKCDGECKFRFEDGECRTSVTCLMEKLYPPGEEEATTNTALTGRCSGKCLFTDSRNNCRLDLICVLDKDIEGTLRFLMDFAIDAETTILLALSAKTNGKEGGLCEENVIVTPPEGQCFNSEGRPVGPGGDSCDGGIDDGKHSVAKPDISSPPPRSCPGKCEVRDPWGVCITDYDCVNNAQ